MFIRLLRVKTNLIRHLRSNQKAYEDHGLIQRCLNFQEAAEKNTENWSFKKSKWSFYFKSFSFADLRQISVFYRNSANVCGRKSISQIRKNKLKSAICGFAKVPSSVEYTAELEKAYSSSAAIV